MFIRNVALSAIMATVATAQSGLRSDQHRELQQPSAKFAASWETDNVVAADCVNDGVGSIWDNNDGGDICPGGNCLVDFCSENASKSEDMVLEQVVGLGKIKIPNNKEILVTLSSQINIFTVNTATSRKGKDTNVGNIGATSAMAGVKVVLYAVPERAGEGDAVMCQPGEVTMASRYVELRNQISGSATYEDCADLNGDGDIDDEGECEVKIADLELESSIGLAMETEAAHSFQWVCPNLPSDVYDVRAMFQLAADANDLCDQIQGNDCATINDLAAARVILGKRIMTIQQVMAVKGSLEI